MKVAASHLDDRAETTIVSAAPRSLNDIDLAPEEGISLEHTRIAIRRPDFAILRPVRRPGRIVRPAFTIVIGKAADRLETPASLNRAQQFAKRNFPFAAHQVIDLHLLISLGRQARI